jgi:uncharacterized protein involved in exopolysaccharide biosynthesis/Mrp family chromosome partitioning ATPase
MAAYATRDFRDDLTSDRTLPEHPLSIIRALRHGKFIIAGSVAAFASLGLSVWFILPPTYISQAELYVEPGTVRIPELQNVREIADFSAASASLNAQIYILRSPEILQPVVERLRIHENAKFFDGAVDEPKTKLGGLELLWSKLKKVISNTAEADDDGVEEETPSVEARIRAAVSTVAKNLILSSDIRAPIIQLRYRSGDPKLAADIVNVILETYIENAQRHRATQLVQANSSLSARLEELRLQLDAANNRVQEYREHYKLAETKLGTVGSQQLAEMNTELTMARSELVRIESNYQQSITRRNSSDLPQVLQSQVLIQLRGQEAEATRLVAQLSMDLGKQHPSLISAVSAVADIREKIAQETRRIVLSIESQRSSALERVKELSKQAAILENRQNELARAADQLADMEKEVGAIRSLYESYLLRVGGRVDPKSMDPGVRVIRFAELPTEISQGAAPLTGTGGMLGLALGTFIAIRRYRETAVVSSANDLSIASGIPVLGVLPREKAIMSHRFRISDLLHKKKSMQLIENLRGLRLELGNTLERAPRTVIFTSSMADEGKSITALMFACVASMDGLNVLLVDADLRRPSLASIMGRKGCDMERILSSNHDWQDLMENDPETGLTFVLPNHSIKQPQRLLGSGGIGQLLSHAQPHFDLVVIDTPPVLMVSDALNLVAYGDVTVLLARSGSASHSGVAEAVRRLSRVNSPPVVTVLSMSRDRHSRGMYHGYGESADGPTRYWA